MAEEEDWDLNALVRSCTSSSSPAAPPPIENGNLEAAFDCLAEFTFENADDDDDPFRFSDLVQHPKNGLQDSFVPFLPAGGGENRNNIPGFGAFSGPNLAETAVPPPPSATTSLLFENTHLRARNQQRQLHQLQPIRNTQSAALRPRKKKSSQKKLVMQVLAENLTNDAWAWRKYGQKPIKGSPYPRNYYRCSSSKGCSARKQVERSNIDPNMFTVSYTGDHTHPRPIHRNSLAGSVRNKFPANPNPARNGSDDPNPEKANGLSPTTPLAANVESFKADMEVDGGLQIDFSGEGDDDEIDKDEEINLIPNMTLNEDLIKGLQELAGGGSNVVGRSTGTGGSPDFSDKASNLLGSSAGATGSCGF